MRESGDAEAVGGGDTGLGAGQGQRAQGGVDRDRAEGPGQLAQSGGQERVEIDGLLHVVLMGGHFTALVRGAHPHSVQLGGLLLEGHRGDQRVDPRGDGHGGVVPEGDSGDVLYSHVGVHFPPTYVRPLGGPRRANR